MRNRPTRSHRWAPRLPGVVTLLALLITAAAILGVAHAAKVQENLTLQVASSGERLWVIRSEPTGAFLVLYRTSETRPDTLERSHKSKGRVIAAAAYDRNLYCVYEDRSVQVMRFATPRPDDPRPVDATQLSPLPLTGQFVGWSAGRNGPWALIRNDAITAAAATAGKNAAATPPPPLELLRLLADSWKPQPLPPDLDASRARLLTILEPSSDRVALLSASADGQQTLVDTFDGRTWSRRAYDLRLDPRAQAVSVQNNICLAQPVDSRGRRLAVHLLREGKALPLGHVDLDTAVTDWWAAAGADDLHILGATSRGLLWTQMAVSDSIDNAPAMRPIAERDPVPTPQSPLTLLVIAAVVLSMLFLFATSQRSPRSAEPKLPADLRPTGSPRIAAALIDMVPALMAGGIVFGRAEMIELLEHWSRLSADAAELEVAAVVLGTFTLHTTLGEMFTGRSLGKALMGCRVVNLQGGPPHVWQVLARNFFKIVELTAPLLLIMPLLGLHHQRLGDLVAGTLVVSPAPASTPPANNNDDEHDEGF